MAVLVALVPRLATFVSIVAAAAFVGIVGVAARRSQIHRSLVVVAAAVAGSYALRSLGDSAISSQHDGRLVGGGLALVTSTCLILALAWLVRARHDDIMRGLPGDGFVVALAAWIVGWIVITEPRLSRSGGRVLALIDSALVPAGAITLFLVVVLLFAERTRRPVIALVAAGISCHTAADVVGSIANAHRLPDAFARLAVGLHIIAFSLAAAGFAHPSTTSLTSARGGGAARQPFGRVVVMLGSLVVPMMLLAVVAPDHRADRIVRLGTTIGLALVAFGRVAHTIRTARVAQAELLRSAQSDPLTGLPNRSLLLARIDSCLRESWHGEQRPTLYFVDLDRFKNINDSLGHAAGDQVLRTVAERLVQAAPASAMVSRLSGDEYVVLDPESADGSSVDIAERLLDVFREPLPLSQGDVFITASVGIATISANTRTSAEDLLRHADTAMYRAKDAGRNCVAFYDESMHERVAHRLAVETALYRALDRRELRMFHQPILDIESGDVVGFEALMRWQQTDGTIVSPAEFIPIAEDTGMIIPIGSWALLEALTQLRRWIDDGICSPNATMSVNVSPRQLADPSLLSIVQEALVRSGVEPRSLWVEITESVMISEPELALSTLQKLKALGVMIALDDFGTGYSSLSLLQRFPLQRIKIDRAFVQGVADSASDRSLVRTIVAMGASLGLDLVAEGVESVHQMQVLRDLGCHKAQGYLISHPVPADAMRSTVAALERLRRTPLLRGIDRGARVQQH